MAITFRARKPQPDNLPTTAGKIAIEVLRDGHPLGVWLIPIKDALTLAQQIRDVSHTLT